MMRNSPYSVGRRAAATLFTVGAAARGARQEGSILRSWFRLLAFLSDDLIQQGIQDYTRLRYGIRTAPFGAMNSVFESNIQFAGERQDGEPTCPAVRVQLILSENLIDPQ